MSITDELRKYARGYELMVNHKLLEIADRIDRAHDHAVMSAMNDALYHANDKNMAEHGWVRGPLDADGKMWRSGDMSDSNWGVIEGIAYEDGRWLVSGHDTSAPWVPADSIRHYHEQTVEDVLREFADRVCNSGHQWGLDAADTIAMYAAKLRLAGDAE